MQSDPMQRGQLRRSGWAFVGFLALELVVVFIGVYAAFAISEYQRRRDVDERRHQIQAALVNEIRDIASNTRRVATSLPLQLAQFDSAVAAGGRPGIQPYIELVRLETHMWDATLQSGALDMFDVSTFYSISQFYNELNAGFEQLAQLRELSENVLIPALGRDSDEFYDADGLRPRYGWYRDGLGQLAVLAASITATGDSLVATLSAGNDQR